MLKKYLKGYLEYQLRHIIGGERYSDWNKRYYELNKISLPSSPYLEDLRKEFEKKHGVLTFAEYLEFDQFSPHGYHPFHKDHGFQITRSTHWGKALAHLCIKENIQHVVDVGCGNGTLGISLLLEAKEQKKTITWSGIEVNKKFHKGIYKHFASYNLEKQVSEIVSTPNEASMRKKSLIVFSFCLDSVPPECFINTDTKTSYPTSILGLHLNGNLLEEVILTDEELKQKNVSLKNGIYTDQDGQIYDLRSWKLYPQQRAYITVHSFSLLWDCINKFPDSEIMLIDEFAPTNPPGYYAHVTPPFNLLAYHREYQNTKNIYQEPGENLYYYPTALSTHLSVLKSLGFTQITYASELRMIKTFMNEQIDSDPASFCGGVYASHQKIAKDTVLVTPPQELPAESTHIS